MMRKQKWAVLILWCLYVNSLRAQQEQVWAFGDHAGLDFNSGTPVAIQTDIDALEGCASVCDEQGQLLFYTNGSIVWDRSGAIMADGGNLTGLTTQAPYRTVTSSAMQGTVIVPMPDSAGRYYVFSLTSTTGGTTVADGGRLYYSVVDMRLAGGMGAVDPARKGIPVATPGRLYEQMVAVRGNSCNVWLLVHLEDTYRYLSYEINVRGFNPVPVVSDAGVLLPPIAITSSIKMANNRSRMVSCSRSGVEMLDFDPATGMLANARVIFTEGLFCAGFSPDDSKLYLNVAGQIVQLNLARSTADSIRASATAVTSVPNQYPLHTDLKCGPDGRLYFNAPDQAGYAEKLDAIPFPNLLWPACQFIRHAVSLITPVTRSLHGLPNAVPVLSKDTIRSVRHLTPACFRKEVQLAAGPANGIYRWNDSTTGQQRIVSRSGTYWVAYTGYGCTYHIDTFRVLIPGSPVTGSRGACADLDSGEAWFLPGADDTATNTYTWYNGSGQVIRTRTQRGSDTLRRIPPGIYTLRIQKSSDCDTTVRITVPALNYRPSFTADPVICESDTLSFRNTSGGNHTYWLWRFGDGTEDTARNPRHRYARPGSYTVTLFAYPCADTVHGTVVVDTLQAVYFTPDKRTVCAGAAIVFSPVYTGSGARSLLWDFGDGTQATGAAEQTHVFHTPGTAVIRLTLQSRACPDTAYSDTVRVYPNPVVDIGPDTFQCPGQPPVILSNLADGNPAYHSTWSTGATSRQITAGQGVFWLRAVTEQGCTATDTVQVDNGCYVAIPNIFTPNNDGINDYFFPTALLSRGVTGFRMQLFNRWGQMIFETADAAGRGWDGTFNGTPQSGGVYVYLIRAVFADGRPETFRGNITLLR